MDINKLLSKRNIIILASAVLVLTLTLTLVFCTKKNEDETQGGEQSGQVTPDGGETETPDNNDTPTVPENPGEENPDTPDTPEQPEIPEQPEHTHQFVEGKCECGEKDPDYVPEPLAYEDYIAMSAEEQEAYYRSFPSYVEFFAWLNAAKAEYDAANKNPTLGEDGSLDVGDIFGD